jgi:hypothetical protein
MTEVQEHLKLGFYSSYVPQVQFYPQQMEYARLDHHLFAPQLALALELKLELELERKEPEWMGNAPAQHCLKSRKSSFKMVVVVHYLHRVLRLTYPYYMKIGSCNLLFRQHIN